MKRITTALLMTLALCSGVSAQTVALYGYSQSVGTYTAISGGSVLGTEANAAQKFVDPAVPAGGTTSTGVGLPIGFDFTFRGVVFDRFAVSTDGWISLGQSALGATAVNMPTTTVPLSTTTAVTPAQLRSRIAALGRDIRGKGAGQGSDLRYQTIGTAPNRTLVVQWSNYERSVGTINTTNDILNFQIRLNETTNVVDVVWGSSFFSPTVATTVHSQVGLGGHAATDFNNRTTTTDWNNTTVGATNTATCSSATTTLPGVINPANGLTMTWTGPNCAPPTATASTSVDCGNGEFTVTVDLTDVGSGNTSVDLVHTVSGTPTTQYTGVVAPGMFAMGPFPLGTTATITIVTSPDNICTLNMGNFLQPIEACPITSYPYCQTFNGFTDGTASTSCTFVQPLEAGWTNTSTPGWLVETSGTANSTNTGPDTDNPNGPSTGTGRYLYIEASGNCTERIAVSNTYDITSLSAGNGAEMSLWYHMFGAQIGTFVVEVEDLTNSPGVYTQLFTQTGNQGNVWLHTGWLDVDAVAPGPLVRFRVRATQTATFEGDAAFDDFCVREALACVPPAATAQVSGSSCTTNDFLVTVDLTSLGDAATVDLVPSAGTPINGVTAPGTYVLGPFPLGSPVSVTVVHTGDAACNINLGNFNSTLTCATANTCALGLSVVDNGCATQSFLNLGVPVTAPGTTLGSDVSLQSVDIITSHTFNGDLRLTLISPDGDQAAVIGTGVFGSGDNLGDPLNCPTALFRLQDGGTAMTTTATSNVTGTFNPQAPISSLNNGGAASGTWILRFCDAAGGDVPTIQFVNLNFITCTPSTATTMVVPACGTNEFNVDVDLTALGNLATDVDIVASENGGVPVVYHNNVSALQVYNVGPFSTGSNVVVSVLHNQDPTCDVALPSVSYTCPINTYPACEDFDTWTNCSTSSTCTTGCTLEEGWSNINTSTWRTWTGSRPSTGTGPLFDHTSGSGKWLYIETSTACPDRVAQSPLYDVSSLNAGNGAEVSVWYHMWDNGTGDMGTFSVAVEDVTNAPGVYNTIFTQSGDQGDVWNHTGWLNLDAFAGPILRFRITGTNTLTFQGDMAMDDFCVREQLPCVPVAATGSDVSDCATNTFSVNVDLTSLGDAPNVDIVEIVNGGAPTVVHDDVSTLQVYSVGPYASTASVQVLVVHPLFNQCTSDLGVFTFNNSLTCVQCTPSVPDNETYCYVASDNQSWTYATQGTGVLRLQFARGTLESSTFDDLIIYDGADNTAPVLFANPANTGNLGPAGSAILSTDPDFFAVDVVSSGGFLHMTLTSDGSAQCSGSTTYDPWEWTVTCIDCLAPVATAAQNLDCNTGNFTVDVDLTGLGNSPTVDIVEVVNGGAPNVVHNDVSLLQSYVMGPYLSTDVVDISVVHATNSNCDLALGSFSADVDCILCGAPAESSTYCYVANDNQSWTYFASGAGTLRLRFNRGTVESSSFDDLIIFDGPDNTYPILFANPANTGNLGPAGSGVLTTDPDFFAVDVLATGQYLHMTFTSDPSVQCATSTTYDPWEWEVFCFDCTAPTATATIVEDCNNYQYYVSVDITSLGDATDVDIVGSVNGGAPTVLSDNVSATGVVTVGPFASASSVALNVVHNQDVLCNTSLGSLSFTCPPTVLCGVYSNSTVTAIPDAGNVVSTIVTGPMMGERIADLDVVIKINHTDLADLDIRLTGPSGTVIDILNDQCASKDSMNVRFSDEAATTIVCGSVLTVPLVGEYRTSGTLADALSAFDTQLFEGTWTLSVTDDLSSDVGSLIQWCLIPTLVTPDCPDVPTGLAVASNTFNSVTLNWTAGATNTGYEIEYGPVGFTPGTGTVVSGTLPPPAVISGLASGASFQFYLTETCAAGDAVVVGPVIGSTLLLVNSYPYCNDLEGYTTSGVTCATVNNLAPVLGWFNVNEGASGTDWLTDENGTGSTVTGPSIDYSPGTTTGNYLYIEASTCASRVAELYSPAFDFSALTNQPVVSFWYHMCGNDGAMGTLTLEMESPVGAGNWTTLFSRSGEDPDQTTEASPWKEVRVTLTNLPATTGSFRITGTTEATGFEGDMAIDYFCVTEAPCFLPQATIANNCPNLFNYELVVNVTNIGPHSGVDISDGVNTVTNVGVGSHTLGTFPNGTQVTVSLTSVDDGTCINTYDYAASCVVPTDDCTQAQLLECGVIVSGNTSGMSNTLPANACPFLGAPSLGGVNWWRFSTPIDQEVKLSTCNVASFNTRISVYEGPDCNNLSCLTLNDDVAGCSANSSELDFLAVANVEYYIAVHGSGAASGVYSLSITCTAPCTPVTVNDRCADAIMLVPALNDGLSIPTVGDNTCAFTDANPGCNLVGSVQGVWYTFNSGLNTTAYLSLLDDDFGYTAPNLSYVLFDGACTPIGATGEIACATSAEGEDILLPALMTNTDYRLLVYNAGGVGTEGTFGVEITVPAQNDAGIDSVHYPNDLVCTSSIAAVVELRNHGAAPLTTVEIIFSFDGGAPQTYEWTGNLAFNASELVELPTTLLAQGPHTLAVSTNVPNGVADEIPANDADGSNFDASGEGVTIIIVQDRWGSETTWEIYDALEIAPVAAGGPYTDLGANGTAQIVEQACLPVTFGNCFTLRVYDAFGDGMCCSFGTGRWEIRSPGGALLLRDNFHGSGTLTGSAIYDGDQSPALGVNPTYGGHEFCLPKGPSDIEASECGVFNNTLSNKVFTIQAPGTGSYMFEFSNPDQAYRRRITLTTRYVKLSQLQTSPLVAGVHYFVRARRDAANDGFVNDNWGSGCEMGLDISVVQGCAQLIDDTDLPTHSCGVTRSFGYSNKVWATPTLGATQYRFRFEGAIDPDGASGPLTPVTGARVITQSSYVRVLNWATYTLVDGETYNVQVEVFVNGVWSGYCGNICTVTIDNPAFAGNNLNSIDRSEEDNVTLYPNPVRDGNVNLSITGLTGTEGEVLVDVYDAFGKRVFTRSISTEGATELRANLDLGSSFASGLYVVDITMGERHTVQRLNIQ